MMKPMALILLIFSLNLAAEDRILLEKQTLTYEPGRNGRTIFEQKIIAQIDRADWSGFGRIYIEDIGGHVTVTAVVTSPDGAETRWDPQLVVVDDDVDSNLLGFDPSRAFVIPGLVDGAQLAYTITRTWTRNQRFEKVFRVGNRVPTDQWTLIVNLNRKMAGAYQQVDSQNPPVPLDKTFSLNRTNRPASVIEADAPSVRETEERIWVSVFPKDDEPAEAEMTWHQAKARLAALHAPVSMDIMRRGRRLTRDKATEQEKIAALYAWVTTQIRDIASNDMIHAHTGSVLTGGYAHPFQKVALLQSLLEANRIPYEVAFYQANNWGRLEATGLRNATLMPMIMIKRPKQPTRYLAPFLDVTNPDLIPESLRYADALTQDEHGQMVQFRIEPRDRGQVVEEEISLKIGATHAWVTHQWRMSDLTGEAIKAQLTHMTPAEISDMLGATVGGARVIDVQQETQSGCTLTWTYRKPLLPLSGGNAAVLDPRELIHRPMTDTVWIEKTRKNDFLIPTALNYGLKLSAQAEAGVSLATGGADTSFQNIFGQVMMKVAAAPEAVSIELNVATKELERGPEALPEYNAYADQLAQALPPLILVTPKEIAQP